MTDPCREAFEEFRMKVVSMGTDWTIWQAAWTASRQALMTELDITLVAIPEAPHE